MSKWDDAEPFWKTAVKWYGTMGLVCLVLWIVFSHFEAKSYRTVTGKTISTWDAMFLDLRVQEAVLP